MNAPDWLDWRETPQQDEAGFRFLSDEERAKLSEGERYEYDECCSNQHTDSQPEIWNWRTEK